MEKEIKAKAVRSKIQRSENWLEDKFVVNLLFNIPKVTVSLMYSVYMLQAKIHSASAVNLAVEYLSALQSLVLMLSPAVCAAMVTSQAEELKIQLHNQLLLETNATKSKSIKKFIAYIEARPCKFYVYNVIPLNANLPAIILNICITYFIVLIQLAHSY